MWQTNEGVREKDLFNGKICPSFNKYQAFSFMNYLRALSVQDFFLADIICEQSIMVKKVLGCLF